MEHSSLRRTVALAGTLIAAGLLTLVFATTGARAAPLKIEFDQSKLNVSLLDDLPLDSIGSDASIEGTVTDDGQVNIPKGQFKMPQVGITTPIEISGYMGIESDATGTFDAATGRLDLDATAGIWASIDIAQALALADSLGLDLSSQLGALGPFIGFLGKDLTCGFYPMDIHFTTESQGGQRFAKGPLGPGAITAGWSQLGPFAGRSKIFGIDACRTLKDLLPGLLSGLGGSGGGLDLGGLDLGSLLDGIDQTDLGPSSITLTRSLDQSATHEVSPGPGPGPDTGKAAPRLKLKVSPRKRRSRRGKTVRYRARVINSGSARAGKVRVCVKAPKRAVRVRACRSYGSIARKSAKNRTFGVRVRRGAKAKRYRIKFITRTGKKKGPKASARLRVR